MGEKLKNKIQKSSIGKLLLIALLVRLIILPFFFHSDLNNNAIWGIYANEFGLRGFYDWLNFGNYARPDYPQLAMVLFLYVRKLWEVLFNVFWKLNTSIALFPSNFIPWFETKGFLMLLKLPGVLADLGIGYLIFKYYKKGKNGLLYSSYFLFNPAVIYLSSVWGQLDSVVSYFTILSILLLMNKKYTSSLLSYFASIFIKATYVPISILLVIRAFSQKIKLKQVLKVLAVTLALLFVVGFIFFDKNYLLWTVNTYVVKILPGAVTLPYINLNAFNFWGIIFGLERLRDSTSYLGISLNLLAYLVALPFVGFVISKAIRQKGKHFFFSALILYFSIFMFFPRVHERYFYAVIALFPFLFKDKRLIKYYVFSSLIFLTNLYHWWWVPNINFLAYLLDLEIVERGISLLNFVLFSRILREYKKI